MTSSNSELTLYIRLRPAPESDIPWEIEFYDHQHSDLPRTNGDLEAGSEVTMIRLCKSAHDENKNWEFHDLTLHPLGDNTDPVHCQWMVTADEIRLRDTRSFRGSETPKESRIFSYSVSLAVHGQQPCKVCFDPQLVNTSGVGCR